MHADNSHPAAIPPANVSSNLPPLEGSATPHFPLVDCLWADPYTSGLYGVCCSVSTFACDIFGRKLVFLRYRLIRDNISIVYDIAPPVILSKPIDKGNIHHSDQCVSSNLTIFFKWISRSQILNIFTAISSLKREQGTNATSHENTQSSAHRQADLRASMAARQRLWGFKYGG